MCSAVKKGRPSTASALLMMGVPTEAVKQDAAAAAALRRDEELRAVFEQHSATAPPPWQHEGAIARLYAAIQKRRVTTVKALLECGVAANSALRGTTALHRAVRLGHSEMSLVLMEHGAPLGAQDDNGRLPLSFSASFNPHENGQQRCKWRLFPPLPVV